MDAASRTAFHESLARGFHAAYLHGPANQRIQLPDEWVMRDDAVLLGPAIGTGEEFPFGAHLAASGLTQSDLTTMEFGMFWRHMPDWGAVGPLRTIANEHGVAFWWTMQGTTGDGRVMTLHEAEFVLTDEEGRITRWEVFFDTRQFGEVLVLVAGLDADVTWAAYLGAVAAFVPDSRPYISKETYAAWQAAGLIPTTAP